MSTENLKIIYNEIIKHGVCKRCALRYLPIETFKPFSNPDDLLVPFDLDEEFRIKRLKGNLCTVCVGICSDEIIDECLRSSTIEDARNRFDVDAYKIHVSIPSCVFIRDRSMRIYLKNRFPDIYQDDKVIKIGKMWRFAIEERLSKKINKKYIKSAKFTIEINISYSLDDLETGTLGDFESKAKFYKYFQDLTDDEFIKKITIPPKPVYGETSLISVKNVSCTVFVLGQYRKLCRTLLQRPYVRDGETIINLCTQNIICDAFEKVLGKFKFECKTYAHDDVKTRILGQGKSFFVEIKGYEKSDTISDEECREIESTINENKVINVINLKPSSKSKASETIYSESLMSKCYKILCALPTNCDLEMCIGTINKFGKKMLINQKCPVRHMNQRIPRVKQRTLYSMKAKKVEGFSNVMELDVVVEAGLLIEEFIHGDLGRTKPSLNKIIKADISINAIDIMGFIDTRIEND